MNEFVKLSDLCILITKGSTPTTYGYSFKNEGIPFIKAEALFKLNITNYPESANCYDGLGDLYLARGEKAKAIESFEKTLSLKLIPETKQKLEALLEKK